MIPLLLIALAMSAVALTYETSPRSRIWVDEHIRAIKGALEAHRTADGHLSAMHTAKDQTTAVSHAHAATTANREAAKATTKAVETARTDEQRAAAAQGATAVIDQANKIADALATLGVGQCDVHTYGNVTSNTRDALLTKLHSEGMTVTGDNPWDIDTKTHGVTLRAVWDPRARELKLIVTAKAFYAPCSAVWDKIDPIMKGIIGA